MWDLGLESTLHLGLIWIEGERGTIENGEGTLI